MRINSKTMMIGGLLAAGTALCASKCSQSREPIDLQTCHNVYTDYSTLKIQDGVSIELNSKKFLMDNGKLMVYNKSNKTWSDTGNRLGGVYDYQKQILFQIASQTKEMQDTAVLSKNDIIELQDDPEKFSIHENYSDRHAVGTIRQQGYIRNTDEKGIVINAYEDSYYTKHYTPNLRVAYDDKME